MKSIKVKPVPSIEFEFPDGDKKIFRLSNRALAILDEEFGGSITAINDFSQNGQITSLLRIVYAGMKSEDESITLEWVEKNMCVVDVEFIDAISEALSEALGDAVPPKAATMMESFLKEKMTGKKK